MDGHPAISKLLIETLRVFRKLLSPILAASATVIAATIIVSSLFLVASPAPTDGFFNAASLAFSLLVLITLFLQVFLQGSVIFIVARNARVVGAFRGTFAKLWKLFLATVIIGAITSLPLIISVGLWLPQLESEGSAQATAATNFSAFIILSIIYFLVLFPLFLFVQFAILLEEKSIGQSIKRSIRLVRRRWAWVFVRYMVFSVLLFLASTLINYIPGIGPLANGMIVVPLSTIFTYFLYRAVRKE